MAQARSGRTRPERIGLGPVLRYGVAMRHPDSPPLLRSATNGSACALARVMAPCLGLCLALCLALCLSLAWTGPARAQDEAQEPAPEAPATVLLSGVVVAADGSGPLEGVAILVLGDGLSASTDAKGRFEVPVPRGRTVTLLFELEGFESKEERVSPDAAGLLVSLKRS